MMTGKQKVGTCAPTEADAILCSSNAYCNKMLLCSFQVRTCCFVITLAVTFEDV